MKTRDYFKNHTYSVGDIVSYRGAFLRSAGWYTNVPRNGRVAQVKACGDWTILDVEWSDGHGLGSVNSANVMPAGVPDMS